MNHRSSRRRVMPRRHEACQYESLEPRAMFAAGDLDTTFGSQGIATGPLTVASGTAAEACRAMATDSKGRTILVGSVYRGMGNHDFSIVRLTAKGLPDKTFGSAKTGQVLVGFEQGVQGDERATCVTIDAQGRILVGGDVEQLSGTAFGVVRLTPSGKLDPTFSGDGRAIVNFDAGGSGEDRVGAILADKAGRIVMVGSAQTGPNSTLMAVARLLPKGQLDAAFDGDGRKIIFGVKQAPATPPDKGTAVAIDAKQRIVFTGRWSANGFGYFGVGRLNGDGSYDTTFAQDGFTAFSFNPLSGIGVDNTPTALRVDASGRIYVAGSIQRQNPSDYDIGVLRITDAGVLDTTFGLGGIFLMAFDLGTSKGDVPAGMAIDAQGRLVVSGTARLTDTQAELAVMRVLPSGVLDSAFASGGKRTVKIGDEAVAISGLRIDKQGRILVAATTNEPIQYALVRLLG